jgi:hypothetical protein
MRYLSAAIAVMAVSVGVAVPAQAALIPTLDSVTPVGGNFSFDYSVLLTGDEGLSTHAINPLNHVNYRSELVIYDFSGYVPGSVFTDNPLFTSSVQLTSPTATVPPGYTDDPTILNLVFSYIGPDLHTSGGPFPPLDLGTFGALSTLPGTMVGAFGSIAVKNTGLAFPSGSANTAAFNQGTVFTPSSATPEASTWAMTILGFGAIGSTLRQRSRQRRRFAFSAA